MASGGETAMEKQKRLIQQEIAKLSGQLNYMTVR
jgi:50S ribosomal subunit-associated GTPase HflX